MEQTPRTLMSPVAITIFNRPDNTSQVFEAIRRARPSKIFLIADAGRNPVEHEQCITTREAIEKMIDWPCEVYKNYAEMNMGARMRLATGINWVFEHVDRAIILEHDCLPSPDFFRFCDELLERYKDDERVMHIGGNDFQQANPDFSCDTSYYFATIPHIWGFATWARAWKHYDVNVSLWPEAEKYGWLAAAFPDPAVRERWEYVFGRYYRKEVESWDAQWVFACAINNGLSINPAVNLVTNIGFGPGALSTKNPNHKFANVPILPMTFPLVHPIAIIPDRIADAYTAIYCFGVLDRRMDRVRWFVKSKLPFLYTLARSVVRLQQKAKV